jgi:hypothetical protein
VAGTLAAAFVQCNIFFPIGADQFLNIHAELNLVTYMKLSRRVKMATKAAPLALAEGRVVL